jgi:hypothetical protein
MRLLSLSRWMMASFSLLLLPLGCGPGSNANKGPQVRGSALGMQTFYEDDGDAVTGTVFDSDGDGRADQVDLDGDGFSDGEDIDGDGYITVWAHLPKNDDTTTPDDLKKDLPSTPPAVANKLAAAAPLPGETSGGPPVRSVGGVNLVSGAVPTGKPASGVLSARNQYQIGSCGAFASGAAVALLRFNKERASNPAIDINSLWPAPLYIYQHNAKFEVTAASPNGECSGTVIANNLDRFLMFGAPAEAELPYERSKARDPNPSYCTKPATDVAQTSPFREAHRLAGHVAIRGSGEAWRKEIKRQLDMGRPITFGTKLPVGFNEFRSTGTDAEGKPIDVTQPFKGGGNCTGTHCGGHAMVITGYDDTRSAYRVLNSWGSDWGDYGYLWWDYAALEATGPHGSALISLPANAPPLGPPNAAAVTVSTAPMTQPALAKLPPNTDGVAYWAVIVRVQWNEPVTVTQVMSDIDGNRFGLNLSQGMLTGDLQGLVIGSEEASFNPQSVVGQTATLTLTATTRDGMTITRTLPSFTVPAPTM